MTRIFKALLTVALIMTSAGTTMAGNKIVERSAKKAPSWISEATEGYIVVQVQAPTIAEAQRMAETEIAERMIMSVARNVSVQQSSTSSETVTSSGVETHDNYTRSSAMRSANLPFLKGISLARADAIYWVKVRDGNTRAEHYEYYVKYPFFRTEQATLEAQFDEYDAAREAEYNALEAEYTTVNTDDGIRSAIASLEALNNYFFDDVRRTRTSALIKRYKDLYRSISMQGRQMSPGEFAVTFTLLDHPFNPSATPKVSSECASAIDVRRSGDGTFAVTFDTSDCLPDEDNYLDVTCKIGSRRFAEKYRFDTAVDDRQNFRVVPVGRIYLSADSVNAEARTASEIHIRLTLDNRSEIPFGLKGLELNCPTLAAPIVIDNIDSVYTTRGTVQVNTTAAGSYRMRDRRATSLPYVSGFLTVVNPASGAVERLKLYLPCTCNWEK